MFGKMKEGLQKELQEIREQGLYKEERIILSDQKATIKVAQGEVLNFCANNYLGLANNKEIIAASKKRLDSHGFGLSSVRFICGTQDIHKSLEKKISDTIYSIFNFPKKIISIRKVQDKSSFRLQSFLLHRKPEFTAKTPEGILVFTLDLFCKNATGLNYLRLVICQKNLVQFRQKLGTN